jgi:cytochrome c oxidase cbb3-type subunit 1
MEREWPSPVLVRAHLGATVVGLVLMVAGLAWAGWHQGQLLNQAAVPFGDITKALTPWFAVRAAACAVLLVGHLAFLINLAWIACPFCAGGAPAQFRNPPVLSLVKDPAAEGHA